MSYPTCQLAKHVDEDGNQFNHAQLFQSNKSILMGDARHLKNTGHGKEHDVTGINASNLSMITPKMMKVIKMFLMTTRWTMNMNLILNFINSVCCSSEL